jgi:hypothetical protein
MMIFYVVILVDDDVTLVSNYVETGATDISYIFFLSQHLPPTSFPPVSLSQHHSITPSSPIKKNPAYCPPTPTYYRRSGFCPYAATQYPLKCTATPS